MMPAFVVNPLSLCIPQSTFEAWLKERGLLEILEKCKLDNAIIAGRGSFTALCNLLKTNPLQKLTVDDLCKGPVPWTGEFFDCGQGPKETYSWPSCVTQAKFRMEENIRKYIGNYLVLILIIFLCFLYKMPLALLGVVSLFGLWDSMRIICNRYGFERKSPWFRLLVSVGNFVSIFLLVYCKVALAIFWCGVVSFAVVIIHSSMRKITPPPSSKRIFGR